MYKDYFRNQNELLIPEHQQQLLCKQTVQEVNKKYSRRLTKPLHTNSKIQFRNELNAEDPDKILMDKKQVETIVDQTKDPGFYSIINKLDEYNKLSREHDKTFGVKEFHKNKYLDMRYGHNHGDKLIKCVNKINKTVSLADLRNNSNAILLSSKNLYDNNVRLKSKDINEVKDQQGEYNNSNANNNKSADHIKKQFNLDQHHLSINNIGIMKNTPRLMTQSNNLLSPKVNKLLCVEQEDKYSIMIDNKKINETDLVRALVHVPNTKVKKRIRSEFRRIVRKNQNINADDYNTLTKFISLVMNKANKNTNNDEFKTIHLNPLYSNTNTNSNTQGNGAHDIDKDDKTDEYNMSKLGKEASLHIKKAKDSISKIFEITNNLSPKESKKASIDQRDTVQSNILLKSTSDNQILRNPLNNNNNNNHHQTKSPHLNSTYLRQATLNSPITNSIASPNEHIRSKIPPLTFTGFSTIQRKNKSDQKDEYMCDNETSEYNTNLGTTSTRSNKSKIVYDHSPKSKCITSIESTNNSYIRPLTTETRLYLNGINSKTTRRKDEIIKEINKHNVENNIKVKDDSYLLNRGHENHHSNMKIDEFNENNQAKNIMKIVSRNKKKRFDHNIPRKMKKHGSNGLLFEQNKFKTTSEYFIKDMKKYYGKKNISNGPSEYDDIHKTVHNLIRSYYQPDVENNDTNVIQFGIKNETKPVENIGFILSRYGYTNTELSPSKKLKSKNPISKFQHDPKTSQLVFLKRNIEKTAKFIEKSLHKTWELNKIA